MGSEETEEFQNSRTRTGLPSKHFYISLQYVTCIMHYTVHCIDKENFSSSQRLNVGHSSNLFDYCSVTKLCFEVVREQNKLSL